MCGGGGAQPEDAQHQGKDQRTCGQELRADETDAVADIIALAGQIRVITKMAHRRKIM